MSSTESDPSLAGTKAKWFGTTHWSVVVRAGDPSAPNADIALAKLCETYWYPLYVFTRRLGQSPEDSQDLVQGFFARLLEKNYLRQADQQKGKFRSFLLIAFKRYMANEWYRANRLKRGGGQNVLSLDQESTEHRYLAEPADHMTPDKAFERQWASTLLDQVMSQLEAEHIAAGKKILFGELKAALGGGHRGSYAEIAMRLGTSEGAVKVAVHRIRHRYRELLRVEIANTVSTPEEIDDEIAYLFAALGSR